MIKLYYAPHTCSLAAHIALEEAGAEYSTVHIDFGREEQRSPEYLAVNPKGRVPAMVTDRGILTETPAMLAFIAQSFPRAHLAPLADPFAFAQVQAFNSYLCSTRSGRNRRDEAQSAGVGRCVLRSRRAGDAEGALGDGRDVYGLR